MFKHEFLKKMDEYGINLADYQIVIDKYVPVSYFFRSYELVVQNL